MTNMAVFAMKENMIYVDAGREIEQYDYKFKNDINYYSKQQLLFIYQTIWECATQL